MILFLVRAGFDVRPVDEHRARVDHMLIERLVEDVREDLGSELLRETLAESIAHRSEMRDLVEQAVTEGPAIRQRIADPLMGLCRSEGMPNKCLINTIVIRTTGSVPGRPLSWQYRLLTRS